ncbi:MAG: membrane protease YdiL (CAAX protease family) [Crocinitomicaceae bacterium]|jgi:membrane protease YdiL (CAAX protease family)
MNVTDVSKKYLWIELILLFVIIPLLLALPAFIELKIFSVIIGFVYVLFALYEYTKFKIKKPQKKLITFFWKSIIFRLIPIIIFGLIFIKFISPESFFRLVIEDTRLWIVIIFFYSLGSVLPQEIIYRNFFFQRYHSLILNRKLFIIINAFLFAISHSFLNSWIVIAVTFLGGLMFALTYEKTRSTILVTIEHSLYGLVLFTIGIGPLLAFPS